MGKNKQSKKRKKDSSDDTSVNTSENTELEQSESELLPLSEVIGRAERVLYEGGDIDKTSTPIHKTQAASPSYDHVLRESSDKVAKQLKDTNRKLDKVLNKLAKLDSIEQKLDSMDTRLTQVENKITVSENKIRETDSKLRIVEGKSTELEKCATYVSNKVDDFQKDIQEMKDSMSKAQK